MQVRLLKFSPFRFGPLPEDPLSKRDFEASLFPADAFDNAKSSGCSSSHKSGAGHSNRSYEDC
jgi:hypothetical protein